MGFTPNFNWEYPDVGSDVDTWGGIANTLYLAQDAALAEKAGTAGALADNSTGFRGLPTASVTADYTFVLDDAGRMKRHVSGSTHNWTIPANASVAYPVGTIIALYVTSASAAITLVRSGGVSLRLAGDSTDANRSLAANGFASLIKVDTNAWVAQGSGLT